MRAAWLASFPCGRVIARGKACLREFQGSRPPTRVLSGQYLYIRAKGRIIMRPVQKQTRVQDPACLHL